MSERIPESIPTSADPRSKRPIKKRALSPRSQTAAQVDALFKRPDQEIRLPHSSSTSLTSAYSTGAPPEIVANVQGSSAGAGSGEFHVYKASRRREYERLRAMDEEVKAEKDLEIWEKERSEKQERDKEKTKKNREKRERLKAKKQGKDKAGSNSATAAVDFRKAGGINGRSKDSDAQVETDESVGLEAQPVGLVIHDDD